MVEDIDIRAWITACDMCANANLLTKLVQERGKGIIGINNELEEVKSRIEHMLISCNRTL